MGHNKETPTQLLFLYCKYMLKPTSQALIYFGYVCSTDSCHSRFIAKISRKMKVDILWKLNCITLTTLLLVTKIINPMTGDLYN